MGELYLASYPKKRLLLQLSRGICLATSAVLFHIINQISLVKIKSRRAAEDYSLGREPQDRV